MSSTAITTINNPELQQQQPNITIITHQPTFGAASELGPRSQNQDGFSCSNILVNTNSKENKSYHLLSLFDGHGEYGHEITHFLQHKMNGMLFQRFRQQRKVNQEHNPQLALAETFIQLDSRLRFETNILVNTPSSKSSNTITTTQPTTFFFSTLCNTLSNVNQCVSLTNTKNGEDRYSYSGACAVVALLTPSEILIANLGDCRAILYKSATSSSKTYSPPIIAFSTIAHTSENVEELKRIQKSGGYVSSNGRINGRLIPSRSFGDFKMKRMTSIITSVPEITTIQRTEQDEFLVLVTDGVTDVLTNADISDIVILNNSLPDCKIAQCIVNEAIRRGSMDNCSAVFVRLSSIKTTHPKNSKYNTSSTISDDDESDSTITCSDSDNT
jgi:serine/threonine protein phosphatase PrpC